MFLHPINLRLYEVVHLYWDRRTKQIAVLRRATDPMVIDPDDKLAYPLKGDRGVLRLIKRYEEQAGYVEAASWPTSEQMMSQQQAKCPIVSAYITAVMDSPTKSIIAHKRILYVPQRIEEDLSIRYGALRARPLHQVPASHSENHPVVLPLAL